MNIALLASNIITINSQVSKGTEYFVYLFTSNLAKKKQLNLTLFASGDSKLPLKIDSVNQRSSFADPNIGRANHKIFELALIAKAFQKEKAFDLYHVNIGAGEIVLPFASFVNKPIVITIHSTLNKSYTKKYFSLFKNLKNVYFISISNAQRRDVPFLNYYKTIYHGIDLSPFNFNPIGGDFIIWSGRAIPVKGADEVIKVAQITKNKTKLFALPHKDHLDWLEKEVATKIRERNKNVDLSLDFEVNRTILSEFYRKAKLFLFPLKWREPFGLVMIEAMACGTPVVAYARGSVPEIIKDGETGFIVNPSKEDVRGNWINKRAGIEGLIEAVERIYSLPEREYQKMRKNCRMHVERNFTVERMVDEYLKVYQQISENFQK